MMASTNTPIYDAHMKQSPGPAGKPPVKPDLVTTLSHPVLLGLVGALVIFLVLGMLLPGGLSALFGGKSVDASPVTSLSSVPPTTVAAANTVIPLTTPTAALSVTSSQTVTATQAYNPGNTLSPYLQNGGSGDGTWKYEPTSVETPTNIETAAPIVTWTTPVAISIMPTPTVQLVVSTPTQVTSVAGNTAGTLRVSVLDVGQGDSILIQSPAGKTMLVDAGDTSAGSRVVADLQARGVTSLDAAVASHGDADHIGGYQAVLSQFSVAHFYDPGYPDTTATYENLLTTIDQKNIQYSTPTAGQTIDLDPAVRIDVLSPDGKNTGGTNDNMLVLRLSYGRTSFLLTGDMPDTLEQKILSTLQPTTVLKVGHHGSKTSSSSAFLNVIKPEIAIISVGAGNPYGHPSIETMGRLLAVGAKVYRTDQAGTVTVTSDGNTYTIATDKAGGSASVQVAPLVTTMTTQQQISTTVQTASPVTTGTILQQTSAPKTSAGTSSVSITALNLQGETVTITNSGSSPVNLAGWKLTDEGAKHSYSFTGTSLPAAGSVTISSGTATGDLKWTSTNVWNNDGDTAYLYDGSGKLVSQLKE
jgi:beta-lactamase superfamily II metal-dependent hydrolase